MEPPFPARLKFEMLDRIGYLGLLSTGARLRQRPIK
jgi:hypothetical protein